MTIYHQLTDDAWKRARTEGLFRDTRGEKGNDEAVRRTDLFLDERLPRSLEASLVSRCRVIYGYLGDEENLLDIQTATLALCSVSPKSPGACCCGLRWTPRFAGYQISIFTTR